MSPRRGKILVVLVWVISFLICFPPLLGWNERGKSGQVESGGVRWGQVESGGVRWGRVESVQSDQVRWSRVESGRVRWSQVGPGGVRWGQVGYKKYIPEIGFSHENEISEMNLPLLTKVDPWAK